MALENEIQWKVTGRRYRREKCILPSVPTSNHPLQRGIDVELSKNSPDRKVTRNKPALHISTDSITKKCVPSFVDPLSSVLEGSDPLRVFVGSEGCKLAVEGGCAKETVQPKGPKKFEDVSPITSARLISWESHCLELNRFTTKQQLTLASSFLSGTDSGVVKVQHNIPDRTKGTGQTGVERVKARLEQLDSLDDGVSNTATSSGTGGIREMGGLTPDQFTRHLMALKDEMKVAWSEEQRVKALKIAIQCVKCLALSSPESFYPCKFATISDMLDTLGSLVYARLNQLLESTHSTAYISPQFEADETARNWFYKVASIRELLPRIYLETALLPCYAFLPLEESAGILQRLILMCRGIGDPLVGAYARMYVAHVGLKRYPTQLGHIITAIEDIVASCNWGWNGNGIEDMDVMKEDIERGSIVAERVFYPPISWLMQAIPKTHENIKVLFELTGSCKGVTQYLLLRSILYTFPPVVLSPHCMQFPTLLDACFAHGENPHDLLVELASITVKCTPPEEQKLELLKCAWQLVVRIKPIQNYLIAATGWVKFAGVNYSSNEIDKILGDVLKRLSKVSSSGTPLGAQSYSLPLLELLTTALSCNASSQELYTCTSFRGLLSIFQREGGCGGGGVGMGNVGEMKRLLETALEHHKSGFSEPTVVQLILSLSASLHDGINALTTQDEQRQIAQLVNTFIRQVDFGKDFELQLEFYVEARAAFSNLDSVLESLIQHVLRLQVSTLKLVKGHHTGKTAAFVRACTAYCFITVPSLSCPVMKMKLYFLIGTVAMVNNCMGQGDACIKSAIKSILAIAADLSTRTNQDLNHIFGSITAAAGYLIAVPDPPDASRPLYLFGGLANGLRSLLNEGIDALSFCRLNLAVLRGVCASALDSLPYHFTDVDGNDTLYGGSDSIRSEAESICTEILSNIITHMTELVHSSDQNEMDFFCNFLETILTFGDITDVKMKSLALSLLTLVNKHCRRQRLKNELNAMYKEREIEMTAAFS